MILMPVEVKEILISEVFQISYGLLKLLKYESKQTVCRMMHGVMGNQITWGYVVVLFLVRCSSSSLLHGHAYYAIALYILSYARAILKFEFLCPNQKTCFLLN